MIDQKELDDVDRQLINIVQLDFPLDPHPFRTLGEQISISEKEVISHLKKLTELGAIRKIGPIIDTRKIGGDSTLIAMRVPEHEINEVAMQINSFDEVSHNYLRPGTYNLWFTVSARSKSRLLEIFSEIKKMGYPFLDLPVERMFKIGVMFKV
ncbi:MAG: Lrp/AsnC family transcriptional regulator [Methanosarcinales archaeon]|nr:MAG: Lrp/AsnC family transcriptional regulator [Methanosarcinales archaeon]